jgi:hypothetical protein
VRQYRAFLPACISDTLFHFKYAGKAYHFVFFSWHRRFLKAGHKYALGKILGKAARRSTIHDLKVDEVICHYEVFR